MNLKYVLYEEIDNIVKITLNRPEVGNALDLNRTRDLFLAIREVREDSSIKAVIVTGNQADKLDGIDQLPAWKWLKVGCSI